ncbi:hypothetical protein ACX0G9_07445 [Flavitalea flava]
MPDQTGEIGIQFVNTTPKGECVMDFTKKKRMIDGLIRLALLLGIVYFGFVFPDSFSDHNKMVHFAAHVGMSFLVASFMYVVCNLKLRISKKNSYILLVIVTLFIGAVYKYFEIAGQGLLHTYSLTTLLELTGVYTSMSQNTAGILAAILLIQYFIEYQQLLYSKWLKRNQSF